MTVARYTFVVDGSIHVIYYIPFKEATQNVIALHFQPTSLAEMFLPE